MTDETKRRVDAYREQHPTETAGCSDLLVESMLFETHRISTEALTHELWSRGYRVRLEMG